MKTPITTIPEPQHVWVITIMVNGDQIILGGATIQGKTCQIITSIIITIKAKRNQQSF